MEIFAQNALTTTQAEAVYHLWNDEYPRQLGYQKMEDFHSYLNSLENKTHFLLIDDRGAVVGWALIFLRDGENWFAIIINSNVHSKGYGTRILNELKKRENQFVGWVIDKEGDVRADGSAYKSPLQFYLKNGFTVLPEQRIEFPISAVKIQWQADATAQS